MIIQPDAALPCFMIIAAMLAGNWLGNKKIPALDFIAAILVLFGFSCVVWLVWLVLR